MKLCRSLFLLLILIASLGCNPSLTKSLDTPIGSQSDLPQTPIYDLTQGYSTNPFSCTGQQFELVTGFDIYPVPVMSEPAARVPFRDPVFGNCILRITDRATDLVESDASPGLMNEYSRVQSFNADNSLILVRGVEGSWYIYDALSLQPLSQAQLDLEPRWSATDPQMIYYMSGTSLMSYQLRTNEQTVVHDFSADFPSTTLSAVWTRFEGSPTVDGRMWGLMAEDEDWLASAYLIYDLQRDAVVAAKDLRRWPDEDREIDSVTISPSGSYFLAYMDKYCEPGKFGTDDKPCGLMVYDSELKEGRGLLRIAGHSDLALDSMGREVLVYQDIDTDTISMLDLTSGEVTPLWPIDFSHTPIGLHFSGRAFGRPGWALVSTYDGDPASYTWMDDQIFAIELKPDGGVVRLAHTHSLVDETQEHDYWAEPHASVNQDFTRVLFTSNWGRSGTGEVEMFMIVLPKDWVDLFP